jgi:nitrogenase molybdenum-cofactor synthesis protein NifE
LSSGPCLYRTSFATDLSETDIVHGGEKRLYRAIKAIIERHAPPAVFVYQTCVPAMIGDDVEAVCRFAAGKLGVPVIPVLAPGFAGSKNLGNKLAGEALLDHVIGTREPEVTTPTDVTIIGEYNVAGELWQVKPLLDAIGIRLLACIAGDGRYAEIATAHRARVAMMVCSQALINVARKLEERYGIPFFEGSFFGAADTSQALRTLARMLVERGAPADLVDRAEALIGREETRCSARLAPIRERLRGKRVLVYTGGHKSWSVVSAVTELGMEVIGTSVRKSTEGDKLRIKEILGDDAFMFEQVPAREMFDLLKRERADIMLSGGRTQFIALKTKLPWVDINQERQHAYCGYEGMVALGREIERALRNPVWAQVRAAAPWEGPPETAQEGTWPS